VSGLPETWEYGRNETRTRRKKEKGRKYKKGS
jgi:hypothetical protein